MNREQKRRIESLEAQPLQAERIDRIELVNPTTGLVEGVITVPRHEDRDHE